MSVPLSKSQQALRGRKLVDMSVAQLKDWIAACDAMEVWKFTPSKARRDWKRGREAAVAEHVRRGEAGDTV